LNDEGVFRIIVRELFDADVPLHVVATYNFSEESIYVDGQLRRHVPTLKGDFSKWDPTYLLALGNEITGNRPWLGQLFLVAIYNRALSEQEVLRNYTAGRVLDAATNMFNGRVRDGLVAFYPFTEGMGNQVSDRSGRFPPVDLQRPPARQLPSKYSFLQYAHGEFAPSSLTLSRFLDIIGNILLFAPLGFFLHAALREYGQTSASTAVLAFTMGATFALAMESLQYFLEARISSVTDVVNNMFGTALGITLTKFRLKRVRRG
jgi:VanZ family protein